MHWSDISLFPLFRKDSCIENIFKNQFQGYAQVICHTTLSFELKYSQGRGLYSSLDLREYLKFEHWKSPVFLVLLQLKNEEYAYGYKWFALGNKEIIKKSSFFLTTCDEFRSNQQWYRGILHLFNNLFIIFQ